MIYLWEVLSASVLLAFLVGILWLFRSSDAAAVQCILHVRGELGFGSLLGGCALRKVTGPSFVAALVEDLRVDVLNLAPRFQVFFR